MAKSLLFLVSFFVCAASFSCSRENEESFLPQATIAVSTPLANARYNYGDTIFISATITGTQELHGYEVAIRLAGSSDNLFFEHHHEHANPLQVLQKWKNTMTQPSQMIVEISAILDDRANKKTQTVPFEIGN